MMESKLKVSRKTAVKKTTTKKEANTVTRTEKLDKLMSDVNTKYGSNAIIHGFPKTTGESDDWYSVQRFSTSIPSLDIALGGGIPIGRYTEIQGNQSARKSTLAIHMTAEFQKKYEKSVLYCDVEGTSGEGNYMPSLGMIEDLTYYNQSSGLEETTQMILDMMKDGKVKLAIIDSLEALVPTKEYDSKMEESITMGIKPRLLGEFFRKFSAINNKITREGGMPFTLIGVNQLREKIGSYGNPEFAPGGKAKDFYQTLCIKLRRGDTITEGTGDNKREVGRVIKFKVEKNKTFPEGRSGEFDMYSDDNNSYGIKRGYCDIYKSIILEARMFDFVERSGAFYYLADDPKNKFQGMDNFCNYLRDHEEVILTLQNKIMDFLKGGN